MKELMILFFSYLVGSVSGSYIIGKAFLNTDVRKRGSGNAGTTNALRVLGTKWGIVTFIIDFLKGLLVTYISKYVLTISQDLIFLSMFFCVIGHDYPFYMKFKGGKGVATTVGCLLIINPIMAISCMLIWSILVIVTKIVSIASISVFICITLFSIFLYDYSVNSLIILFFTCLLGIYKHKSNIKRILNGSESKIGVKS